jgi:hypothetical protein
MLRARTTVPPSESCLPWQATRSFWRPGNDTVSEAASFSASGTQWLRGIIIHDSLFSPFQKDKFLVFSPYDAHSAPLWNLLILF